MLFHDEKTRSVIFKNFIAQLVLADYLSNAIYLSMKIFTVVGKYFYFFNSVWLSITSSGSI